MVLDSDISGFQAEMQAATEIREKEKEDYKAEQTDLSESVDAVTRAVNVVKSKAADKAQAMVQLRVVSNLNKTPKQAQRALQAFLQSGQDPEGLSVTAPEAAAYEFQSDGIVDMLEKLKDKFADERNQCEKEEMEKKHAYSMMMQDLQDEIERATAEKGRKVKSKATREEDAAGFKGDLADTTASKEADEKYLSDMVSGCSQKSEDFEARQKLRQEELVALEKATEVLKSGSVSGAGEAHLPTLVQTPSFAMLRSAQGGTELLQERVSQFLKDKADSIHSRRLSLLATRVAEDPFG